MFPLRKFSPRSPATITVNKNTQQQEQQEQEQQQRQYWGGAFVVDEPERVNPSSFSAAVGVLRPGHFETQRCRTAECTYFPLFCERLQQSGCAVAGRDASHVFESVHHSEEAREMMQAFYVGQYVDVSMWGSIWMHVG